KTDVLKKRFETDPGKQTVIRYTGVDDDVIIEKHDKNEILFTFEKVLRGSSSKSSMEYFEQIQPEIEFENNTLEIEIKYPRRSFMGSLFKRSPKITSRLLVPANTDVKLKVIDGDVMAEELKGKMMLKTVDGDMVVNTCSGSMELRTIDGDINAKHCNGTIKINTVDGDVNASGVFNSISFKSVDGEGFFTLEKGSRLTADCSLRTVDGDMSFTFPEDFGFNLDFKGHDGEIKFHGIEFKKVSTKKENRFEGERGNAQYSIQVRTGDGDLSLMEL
ncbi:MAG: DUF4097 domain-containing protein, partial [bacterium]|nr:DUF4097 domain-containing protein [bacterium]